MQCAELHLHTHLSLLDGLNNPDEYMRRASELGMTHLAVTDHGTLSAHREHQRAGEEHGITPILGCEMYISPTDRFDRRTVAKRDDNTQIYNHLTVLAQNEKGLANLNRLSEKAWTEGFYYKPRIDMELLEEYSDGLIVLSGCLNGLISKAIDNKMSVQADMLARDFKRILGERFFIEIQGHNPQNINKGLLDIASNHRILPVVTSDCHYARKEDLWLEEAMLILSTGPKPAKSIDFSKSQKMDILERFNYLYPDRQMTFQEYEIYLRSATEHHELLAKQGIETEPIKNTMVVANMIDEYPYHENLDLLPRPKTDDPDALLRKKVKAGMKRLGHTGIKQYEDRVEEELKIIIDKGFSSYFIIEANTLDWARSKDIFIGPGRGSAAGSYVCYALGITGFNPLDHNLLFFRFINPERNDFPDIDTDVEIARRSEVKDYAIRQYKNVASIATFGKFKGKSSVRAAARVFRVPLGDVNRALKGAHWPNDWFDNWEKTDAGRDFKSLYPEVVKLAKFLFDRLEKQGMHAGGIIMSNEPINKYAPMQTASPPKDDASGNRIPLVALDMEEVAKIGFIKFDFLGVKALTTISDTLKSIRVRHDKDIDLYSLPLDDAEVYKELSQGYTKGVFQCEAGPYTNTILDMGGLNNFDELAASNALVRPGSMKSTAGKSFLERKHDREGISYPHPDMEWFTKETYGVVIYQEQVMLTMTELAGMNMSTADKVRKIIGKKRDVKEFEQYKAEFIDGASKKIPKHIAERLWHDFEAHAGYSFNKSHAVAYSIVSYWTAWLKKHYPIEFMTATLKNEKENDSLLDYLMEIKRLGIRVKLPHVNSSDVDFEIQSDDKGDFIRFGLSDIKYIQNISARKLMKHRPYQNYQQLRDIVTAKGSGMNVRMLKSLNAIGGAVFDDNPLTGEERYNLYEYLNIPAFDTKDLPPKMKTQFRTLDEYSEDEAFVVCGMVRGIKTGPGWARVEMVDETGSAGIFADEHTTIQTGRMYVLMVSNNRVVDSIMVQDLADSQDDDDWFFIKFLKAKSFPDVPEGMLKVVQFRSRVTKAGKKMADVVLADAEKNLISAMVFPSIFYKAYTYLRVGETVDVKLSRTDSGTMFVDNIIGV